MASAAIERYLLAFNHALVAGAERRERILCEVEDHFRDATQSLIAAGYGAEAAQVEAVKRFGSPAEAAERFGPDPLGRAQRASRRYEACRIAHPWALPVVLVAPWVALTLTVSGVSWMFFYLLCLLVIMLSSNASLRRRTGAATASPVSRFLCDRPRLNLAFLALMGTALATVVGTGAYRVFHDTTDWFQAIGVFYLVCAAVVVWARPGCCADPACLDCGARWATRHAKAGATLRYGAWALALAGPALAQIVPVADSRTGTALLFLGPFACLPLPSRRAWTWLCRRRPANNIAIRAMPGLIMFVCYAIVTPGRWFLPVTVGAVALFNAIHFEILAGRAREDQTRRRLHARAHGVAGSTQQ